MSFGWGNLAANQMVSFTDAQGSGFTLKAGQSHVTSEQCMSRSEMTAKYNVVDPASYALNRLVPKSEWVALAVSPTYTCGSTTQTVGSTGAMHFTLGTTSGSVTYNWAAIDNYSWRITVTYNGAILDQFEPYGGSGSRTFNYTYNGSVDFVTVTYQNIS